MNKSPRILVLAAAIVSLGSNAQTLDLGADVSPMTRFQIHPHLDKAFEANARGDGRRAIAELEAARRLAPDNMAIALHLADAYERYGQTGRAIALLTEQSRRHPNNAQVASRLRNLHTPPALVAAESRPAPVTPAVPPARIDTAPIAAGEVVDPTPSPPQSPLPVARADRASRSAAAGPGTQAAARAVARESARRRPVPTNTAPSVEINPGYSQASEAYAATERNDFETALPLARQAVQLAPGNVDYQRLLVYLLIVHGLHEEAEALAEQVEQSPSWQADAQWTEQREAMRQRRTLGRFASALQAQERGDTGTALMNAEAAVLAAPAVDAYRMLWVGHLLEADFFAKAQQVADDGLALGSSSGVRVLRAAALQAQGHTSEATAAFDAALSDPELSSQELRNYRLIALDAALAARQYDRAQTLMESFASGSGADIAGRQAEVRAATQRVVSPSNMPSFALRLPIVNCFGADSAPGCEVWPGQGTPDPALGVAQEAYAAYALRDYEAAAEKALQASQRNPAHLPYQLLRLQALVDGGAVDQALAESDTVLSSRPDVGEVLALRSRVFHQLGQHRQASADADAALRAGGLSLSSEVNLLLQQGRAAEAAQRFAVAMENPTLSQSADPDVAYLAARVGDDATALAVFDRARERALLPTTSLRDGAYTASRLAETERSVEYFSAAIDAAEEGRLSLTPKQQFETRREIADRSRRWGFNALVGYRGVSPGSISALPALYGDVGQVVGEVYWRPQGFRDGSFWELYAAAAQNVYSKQNGPTGGDTTQGAIGARAKPLRDHNLVLSVERRFRIGSLSTNDWLLRAGYSGGTGTDLRVDVPDWTTVNVFAEAGRFIRAKQNYVTTEAQAGRSYRMGDAQSRWVVFPHAVVGVDYNSQRTAAGYNGAAGAGVGVAARYWFREDTYNAPRSYVDVSLQYRARLAGDERGKGVFMRVALVY